MNIARKILLIVCVICTAFIGAAQNKMKLAVLDPVIAGEKLTDGLAISVREIVSGCFVNNADNYAIVERSLIDKVMQEAKFSNSDAVDESQATQLGKLAGADKVVLTVISRFDNRCMMSIKLIDVESATIDRQISKLVDLTSLLDVTEPLTLAVLGKADASQISLPAPSSSQAQQKQVAEASSTKAGGLKSLFGAKKSNSKAQTKKIESSSSISTDVPEFDGSGINYKPLDIEIGYQSDKFSMNFGELYTATMFNIVVDFSDAKVMGMPLLKFREMKRGSNDKVFGADFFNRMTSEVSRLTKALNDASKVTFTYIPDAPITLLVKVREIDEPGRENVSDFVFIETGTGKVLNGIRIKSKGGRFGSFTNLLGDAFEEDAASKFGKEFKAAKKKFKKSL